MAHAFTDNAIFWVELEKVQPNPYQPRQEFNEEKLRDLSESLRQYGVLQPLTVTRKEIETEDGLHTEYELIAGERRLRAAKIAGLSLIPVIIRSTEDNDREKLELAIIENVQREDLNPVDRAEAFQRLIDEFKFKHGQVAQKIGKSREYVSNSLRLLQLPEDIRMAISSGSLSEGHARPLMMLSDRPEEQRTLFKEVVYKKLTVREAETIARKVAHDKIRKKQYPHDPEIEALEGELSQRLGTRVSIERREVGGKIVIDYFSNDDLKTLIDAFQRGELDENSDGSMLERYIAAKEGTPQTSETMHDTDEEDKNIVTPEERTESVATHESGEAIPSDTIADAEETPSNTQHSEDDTSDADSVSESDTKAGTNDPDEELYTVRNFSI